MCSLVIDWDFIISASIVGILVSLGSTIASTWYSNWIEKKITCKKEKENRVNYHKKKLMMEFNKWIIGAAVGGGIGVSKSPCLSMKTFIRNDELIDHLKNYPEFWNIRKEALKLRDKYKNEIDETFKEIEEKFINLIETEGISIQTYYHNESIIKREFFSPEKLGLILHAHIRQGKEFVPFKVRRWNGKYCVDRDGENTIIAESNEKVKAESISRIANQVSKRYFEKIKSIEKDYEESEKLRKSFDDKMLQLTLDVEEGTLLKGKCRVCEEIYNDC